MGSYRGGYIYRNSPALLAINAAIMAGRQRDPQRAPDGSLARGGRHLAPCGTDSARRRHREHKENCPACGYTWLPRGQHARMTQEQRRARAREWVAS